MGLFCKHRNALELERLLIQAQYDAKEWRIKACEAERALREQSEAIDNKQSYAQQKISEQNRAIDEYIRERKAYLLANNELIYRLNLLESTNKYLMETIGQITKCNEQRRLN